MMGEKNKEGLNSSPPSLSCPRFLGLPYIPRVHLAANGCARAPQDDQHVSCRPMSLFLGGRFTSTQVPTPISTRAC
eukprot:2451290-Rhodomonas_salina.2